MEFPLKPDFFPPLRLTTDDRHRYVATAEYSVHVLRKLVADDKWKRISEAKGMTIGKVHCIEEQAAYGGAASQAKACLILCASVFTTGAVSEVLEAIASPVTEDYRRAMGFLYGDRFVDGVCLHTISPHGSRNTQAFTTIKWAAFKDGTPTPSQSRAQQHAVGTDYCFLEHSGMQKETHRDDAFGFCIQESIARDAEVPVLNGLGLGRGELHRTGILVVPTDRKDVVQISSILQMDTATSLSKAALEKLMARRVSAVARLPLLLDRRRLSRMQFIPREHWVRDHERRLCAVCTKTFGLRRKHHCRNCGEVVCATCAPPRDVDVSSYGIASIRICNACIVQSRASSTLGATQHEDVLVCHVRPSMASHATSHAGDDLDLVLNDGLAPRKVSSVDSNFSISSDDDDGDDDDDDDDDHGDDDDHDHYGGYDQEGHYGYDGSRDRGDSHVGSIAPASPTPLESSMARRYSEYSDARSSDMSFSDLNTLADDALRITSVPPRPGQQAVSARTDELEPKQRTLYRPDDPENKPPNDGHAPVARRESMDEWFAPRAHQAAPPPQQQKPVSSSREHMDDWGAPRAPSTAASRASSGSSATRESMDEWFAPRRRDRNHSQLSTGSGVSGRGSSSASSSSSLLDMLSSIREIKNDLAAEHQPQHQPSGRAKNDVYRQEVQESGVYLERLSEQLREPELPEDHARVRAPIAPPTPVLFLDALPSRGVKTPSVAQSHVRGGESGGNTSSEAESRGGSASSSSTVDIDMFNSDSFSLLCPETLQRQRFSSSNQEAGERRSARVSSLSTSTVLEDVEDYDSMRQSELTLLRMQVEDLHRSLEDATNKLNHYTARSAAKQQANSLELESTDRSPQQRRRPSATDRDAVERKQQYHALIDELHEIMGLPALAATRPRSEELLVNAFTRRE